MEEKIENKLLSDFEKECQSIHTEQYDKRQKGLLYHFTNFKSLSSILESRRLRYTDYKYFNDPTEIRFGQNIILNCIADSELPHKDLISRVITSVFDVLNNDCRIFVSCYSTDVKKLALWRYYGNDGCGFAIAFNENYQKINENKNSNVKQIISRVLYGDESKELVNRFIRAHHKTLNEARGKLSNGNFLQLLDRNLISHLLSIIPIMKDESFKDEGEIRIYCMEGKLLIDPETNKPIEFPDEMRDFIDIEVKKIPFVNSLSGKIPVLFPEQFERSSISEIWVGPCCEFIEAKKEIKKLISQFGYSNIEIKQNPLPYRK